MYRNILVPVDLTDRHNEALTVAGRFAAHSGGRITLVHVIEIVHGLPPEADPDFYRKLETTSHDFLERMIDRLRPHGAEARAVVLLGERGPQVLRFARDEHADLIVLSSHAIDPTAPGAGWLSLSYLISIGAPCSVLLVK
jgi:nucleotide-binding universal stress UspA family protein